MTPPHLLCFGGTGGLDGIFVMKGFLLLRGPPLPNHRAPKDQFTITVVDWDDIGMTWAPEDTKDELQKWMVCRCYLRGPEPKQIATENPWLVQMKFPFGYNNPFFTEKNLAVSFREGIPNFHIFSLFPILFYIFDSPFAKKSFGSIIYVYRYIFRSQKPHHSQWQLLGVLSNLDRRQALQSALVMAEHQNLEDAPSALRLGTLMPAWWWNRRFRP